MTNSIFDGYGQRKYLVASERAAFVTAALAEDELIAAFCLTLAITGARISEVLSLTVERIDVGNETIVFETLKQRRRGHFRAVPVPTSLLRLLRRVPVPPGQRLWPWGRTTAWKIVKALMQNAGIVEPLCKPKALRHAFAVEAGQNGVPLNIVQPWLGHARIETTAIYSAAVGNEERALAARSWKVLENTRP